MAARDILALNATLAPRLIRCLYLAALILIAAMVVLGVVRGVRIMTRPAPPPMTVTADAAPGQTAPAAPTPDVGAPEPPRPGMMGRRFGERRMMMEHRFGRRGFGGPRPFGMFGMGRNPLLAGAFVIFSTVLRGAIMLMIVRILAELGLAVLAMPRRTEAP